MKALLTVTALILLVLLAKADKVKDAIGLSEAEVAYVLKTFNDTEIDIAKLAKRQANDSHVKSFADLMEIAHRVNNDEYNEVIRAAQIKPENNGVSKTLKKDSKNKIKQLKESKSKAQFDKIYVENQILIHKQLLEDLDQKYIPNMQDKRFKAYLEKTREHVKSHYDQAIELQSQLAQ